MDNLYKMPISGLSGLFANAVLDALANDVIGKGELAVTYRREDRR